MIRPHEGSQPVWSNASPGDEAATSAVGRGWRPTTVVAVIGAILLTLACAAKSARAVASRNPREETRETGTFDRRAALAETNTAMKRAGECQAPEGLPRSVRVDVQFGYDGRVTQAELVTPTGDPAFLDYRRCVEAVFREITSPSYEGSLITVEKTFTVAR